MSALSVLEKTEMLCIN